MGDLSISSMQSMAEDGPLTCPICTDTCCEPITTQCGHIFCRICLYQSTVIAPDGRHCPVCRGEVTVLDDKGALLPIDPVAEATAKELIPTDEYAQRVQEALESFTLLSAVAMEELPVFYLSSGCRVGQEISLHLFEPRYKVLIRRALEGSRRFAFATRKPQAAMQVTVVEVLQAQLLPDGRALVAGRGTQSVVMDKVWVADGTAGLWMCSCKTSTNGRPSEPIVETETERMRLPVFYGPSPPRTGQASLLLFEPRYKLMVRRVFAGSRCFAWATDEPQRGGDAVVVKIERASFLADGRAQISVSRVQDIQMSEVWCEEALHGLHSCSFVSQGGMLSPSGNRRESDTSNATVAASTSVQRCQCALM